MGVPAQPTLTGSGGRRGGFALAATLFGLVVIGTLASGMWVLVDLDAKIATNRVEAMRALDLAEAGAAHALSLVRTELADTALTRLLTGDDAALGTEDDGRFIGFGMPEDSWIPVAGRSMAGGTYTVDVIDDPDDGDGDAYTDSNHRILARCTGTTGTGATATVHVLLGPTPLPGVITDGSIEISGSPEILGECGGIHANEIVVVSGSPTVEGSVSASDTVQAGNGEIKDVNGDPVQPLHHQPPLETPELNPWDYCTDPRLILRDDGYVVSIDPVTGARDSLDASVSEQLNWKWQGGTPPTWELAGNTAEVGTVCAEGNVRISGSPGNNNPVEMSVIATGSIHITGTPELLSSHDKDILLMASGDVQIGGNVEAGTGEEIMVDGLVYAGSQCGIAGNPEIGGQLLCKDDPDPPGAANLTDSNVIDGNPTITYNCGNPLTETERIILGWYQKIGN